MNIGDFLTPELKTKFTKNKIKLGATLLIRVPKFKVRYDKYIILVAEDKINKDPFIAYVVINSVVNKKMNPTPYLKSLHLKLDKANHPFLKRDSFVDCTKLREYTIKEIVDSLIKNPDKAVGNVSLSILKEIHIKLSGATVIKTGMKKKYGLL